MRAVRRLIAEGRPYEGAEAEESHPDYFMVRWTILLEAALPGRRVIELAKHQDDLDAPSAPESVPLAPARPTIAMALAGETRVLPRVLVTADAVRLRGPGRRGGGTSLIDDASRDRQARHLRPGSTHRSHQTASTTSSHA